MSPRKIISQELIDWANDDELVEEGVDVTYVQVPFVVDDEPLPQPKGVKDKPTNRFGNNRSSSATNNMPLN